MSQEQSGWGQAPWGQSTGAPQSGYAPQPGYGPQPGSAPQPQWGSGSQPQWGPAPAPAGPQPWGPQGSQWSAQGPVASQWGAPAVVPSALPVVGRQYHEFWRAPKHRWWKALLALLCFWVVWFVISNVLAVIAVLIDRANGVVQQAGTIKTTPALFLMNNLGLAAFIPLAMLFSWAFTGQRPKWLTSVEGGMRWRWLSRAAMVIVPLWIFYMGGLQLLGGTGNLHSNSGTVLMIFGILFTTPLQCAGEEYALRGITSRVVGSWIPHRIAGLIVSALVSAGVFTYLHNAQDIYLNIFYFCFALTGSYLTWRTGGLEAAIVLHVTNNLLAEATLPWTDFSDLFDRSSGKGSPWGLLQVVFCIIAIALVEVMLRRTKHRPRNETAPGNPALDAELVQRAAAPRGAKAIGAGTQTEVGQPGQRFTSPGFAAPGAYAPAAGGADPYAAAPGSHAPGGSAQDPYAPRDPYAPQGLTAGPAQDAGQDPDASQASYAPSRAVADGQVSDGPLGSGADPADQDGAHPARAMPEREGNGSFERW